jgi:hypothetical protein
MLFLPRHRRINIDTSRIQLKDPNKCPSETIALTAIAGTIGDVPQNTHRQFFYITQCNPDHTCNNGNACLINGINVTFPNPENTQSEIRASLWKAENHN